MIRQTWGKDDFTVNAMFWKYWGLDVSLPFRVANLVAVQTALYTSGIEHSLFGKTLRDVIIRGGLGPDHDDDLLVSAPLHDVLGAAGPSLAGLGFKLIRQTKEIISIERWGRYIDIHSFGDFSLGSRRVHGANLSVAKNADELVAMNDARKITSESPYRRIARLTRQSFTNPRLTIQQSSHVLRSASNSLARKTRRGEMTIQLSEHEFRSLKLDSDNSVNWNWRGDHLLAVTGRGMTIGDTIEHLSKSRWVDGLIEPVLDCPFDEPIQLSTKFWESGNMFFAAPILYGFRHLVMPYKGANLYINRGISPLLFSSEYFASLEEMKHDEVAAFLSSNPLEVSGDHLTSGRHRASAMLGRLLRGEPYIPVPVRLHRP